MENVTYTCFALSYLVALGLELARLKWPRSGLRLASLLFGSAGLLAHSIFLGVQHPTLATPHGSLLAVAWVLAIFYLYGTLHHPRQVWAIFVLPVVLGLVGLGWLVVIPDGGPASADSSRWFVSERVWGAIHGIFLLLAAVGVSVGFLASVMYLVQAQRLKAKASPQSRFKLLNLERLEQMNRRAVNLAFPLLTIGLLIGAVLLRTLYDTSENWFSVKVVGTVGLWMVCLLLCYLRYAVHVPGRRLAGLTIVAFALMVLVLVSAHPFAMTSPGMLPQLPGAP